MSVRPLTTTVVQRAPGEQSNVATLVPEPVPKMFVKRTSWMYVFDGFAAQAAADAM